MKFNTRWMKRLSLFCVTSKMRIFIIYHWSIDYYPKDHNNMIFLNFSCLFTFYGCSKSEFLTKDPTWAFEKTNSPQTKIALLVVSKSINIWIFIISWKKNGATLFEAILHPQIMQVCGWQNSLKMCSSILFSADYENSYVNWFGNY